VITNAGFASLMHGTADFRIDAFFQLGPFPPALVRTFVDAVNVVHNPDFDPVPIAIDFEDPQRLVGLHLGRVLDPKPGADHYAVLRAFDADGFVMHPEVVGDLPQGVQHFVGVGAIYPDRLISRLEVEFGGVGTGGREPAHIDEIVFCGKKRIGDGIESGKVPTFGDHKVDVVVAAEVRNLVPKPGSNLEHSYVVYPMPSVPVEVNQLSSQMTTFTHTQAEGTWLRLKAPAVHNTMEYRPLASPRHRAPGPGPKRGRALPDPRPRADCGVRGTRSSRGSRDRGARR